jgi:hypothetical protein
LLKGRLSRHNGKVRKILQKIRQIDLILEHEVPLLLLLLLLVVLRLPNFLEPYWYGDEGIYLTLGVALKQGAKLYAEIIDHKTPIIYYLAMVPNQLWFRFLTTCWMLVTTAAFYHIALRLLKKLAPVIVATFMFVIFTSVPWLEGNIPNGELFVMGFILMGGLALLYTEYFDLFMDDKLFSVKASTTTHLFQQKISSLLRNTKDHILYLIAGVLFGLAILTKVPALFDVAAFLSVGWFIVTSQILSAPTKTKIWQKELAAVSSCLGFILAGVVGTILFSIVYFVIRGSGQAYLDYGLLYNFRYVQSWSLPFSHPALKLVFTLPGKLGIAAILISAFTVLRQKLTAPAQFAATWLVLALVASLLSNRPYPHYFLQLVPPACLLIGATLNSWKTKYSVVVTGLLTALIVGTIYLLDVGFYSTSKYYVNSFKYVTGQLSKAEYYQSFDHLMTDNYHAASLIAQSDDSHLFIWGTNPMLYALTQKMPVGRFTVSFHIKDFDAYQETMDDVYEKQPQFIVVMKNETHQLEGLSEYLAEEYIMNSNFTYFELWKRR